MKPYTEVIRFIANEPKLRYNEWAALLAVAEAYDVSIDTAFVDLKKEKDIIEQAEKDKRKAAHRASNEARRLANLERNV